ncbi:MAG: ATP synthase subunit I [Ottowia sp.]|nr:hypothetical protein [Ottowia sp.]
MPDFDTRAVLLGLGVGLAASSLFFAGLGWGLRWALRVRQPVLVLLPSFLLRAALLLAAAWWLARAASPLWSLPAYMLAFFLVRGVALRRARRGQGNVPVNMERS